MHFAKLAASARILGSVLLVCSSASAAATRVYDISAKIDTTDYLIIKDNTLQWHHNISGSPAGEHLGHQATIISSTLDGVTQMSNVAWDQQWPSPLPADAYSDLFQPLNPALPETGELAASVIKLSGRGTPSIFQQPTSGNDYALIVQFTDGFNGDDTLSARISVIPEPASLVALSLLGGAAVCGQLRRRGTSLVRHQS